ncbi:MAG TPA: EAL domain-containing protein [Bryobacteraceae bacterium]|nr:EAL domain-containing protein [Bryobacteraceae bacterium]
MAGIVTPGPERLLLVDEDAKNREMLSRRLIHRGYEVDVAESAARAIEKIGSAQYDLVLLDSAMPGMNGLNLLKLLRATCASANLPAVMVTALDQSQAVVDTLHRETGFAAPPRPAWRPSREDRDALTGLGSRKWLLDCIAKLKSENADFAVLMVDLDGFAVVNHSAGPAAGDLILRQIAERLERVTPPAAMPIARLGGDKFGIILNTADRDTATRLADSILQEIRRPYLIDGNEVRLSASLGIAMAEKDARRVEDVLCGADLAMHRAKQRGKNRWQLFEDEMRESALIHLALTRDLRHAIDRGELFPAYQAKVDLQTRRIVGFEALARWQHPERGLILPGSFIPVAEESGMIIPIGEWILSEACRQLKKWQALFPSTPPLTMSVNLSVKQLADSGLAERVYASLKETGIPPETLRLELTESALMLDLESSRDALAEIQALGVGLKLDDFGTGYSSFSYLEALHFNSLKIDQSFVARVSLEPESHAIVDSIIRLAHALDMTVVAEGIETQEQAEVLAKLGCDAGQGYYFSRPVDAARAEEQLRAAFRR